MYSLLWAEGSWLSSNIHGVCLSLLVLYTQEPHQNPFYKIHRTLHNPNHISAMAFSYIWYELSISAYGKTFHNMQWLWKRGFSLPDIHPLKRPEGGVKVHCLWDKTHNDPHNAFALWFLRGSRPVLSAGHSFRCLRLLKHSSDFLSFLLLFLSVALSTHNVALKWLCSCLISLFKS